MTIFIVTMKSVVILVTIFACFSCVACQDTSGDLCYTSNNVSGTCTLASECRSFKNITKKSIPVTCSFMGTIPIICCPPVLPVNETEKRISVMKCNVYSDCKLLHERGQVRQVRSVDSEQTNTSEFPHMVGIGWKLKNGGETFLCEGSLVSENFVLTSAHCSSINHKSLKSIEPTFVRLGDVNLKTSEGNKRTDIKIKEIITHPKYSSRNRYHDIALIKLEKPIVRSPFMNPACLWRSRNIPYEEGIITGWGTLDFLEDSSDVLRKKTVEIVDGSDCSNTYRYSESLFPDNIISEQLCATDPNATTFTCQGDTGSPLQIMDGHSCSYHLIGVTAYGAGCAGPNLPAVYTRISSYIAWIEDTVWEM